MSRHQVLSIAVLAGVVVATAASIMAFRRPPQPAPTPTASVASGPSEQQIRAMIEQRIESRLATFKPEPAPAVREPEPPSAQPSIRRVPLNGQDLAELEKLSAWRFEFSLPMGRYTGYIWTERWTRGSEMPEVRLLSTGTAIWGQDRIVLKLPGEDDPRLFVQLGDVSTARAADALSMVPPRPLGRRELEAVSLEPGVAVNLVTLAHNASGLGADSLEDAHTRHDQTLYVKAGFARGEAVPFDNAPFHPFKTASSPPAP